jgi:hypothetical protein
VTHKSKGLNFEGKMAGNAQIDQNIERLVKYDQRLRALVGGRDHAGLLELASEEQVMPCIKRKALMAASEMKAV